MSPRLMGTDTMLSSSLRVKYRAWESSLLMPTAIAEHHEIQGAVRDVACARASAASFVTLLLLQCWQQKRWLTATAWKTSQLFKLVWQLAECLVRMFHTKKVLLAVMMVLCCHMANSSPVWRWLTATVGGNATMEHSTCSGTVHMSKESSLRISTPAIACCASQGRYALTRGMFPQLRLLLRAWQKPHASIFLCRVCDCQPASGSRNV